jgi:3'-phosphoadenosine 5'-phosphosulfate sulfotransferase (PAPS reductase)/FAD synthetase
MKVGPIENFKQWSNSVAEIIGERTVVCSISGGKDSTCMALLLTEAGIQFDSIFIDTGWEHETTLEYIESYLPQYIGRVKVLQNSKGGMSHIVRGKGYFPGKTFRYCTGELKIKPAKRYFDSLDIDPVNAVGIRAEESKNRAKYPEWEYSPDFQCDVWRPIIRFSEQDVIDMLRRHNVRPNPLYLIGSQRVGCWPCVFASKRGIRLLADEDPDRIDLIEDLEIELTNKARHKNPRAKMISWFRIGESPTPIRDVVDWAFNDKSNREPLLADDRSMGCMRWGMCEFEHPIDQQKKIIPTDTKP